jgi:hypothetical protein
LDQALTFYFAIAEAEIRKQNPSYIAPTIHEFYYAVSRLSNAIQKTTKQVSTALKQSPTKSSKIKTIHVPVRQLGGDISESMKLMIAYSLNGVVGAAIGRFDTPCDQIMSYISIVLIAVTAFTFVQAIFDELPFWQLLTRPSLIKQINWENVMKNPKYANSIADPVNFFLRKYCTFFMNEMDGAVNSIQSGVSNLLKTQFPTIEDENVTVSTLGSACTFAVRKVFASVHYELFITRPVAFLLQTLGMVSCLAYLQ